MNDSDRAFLNLCFAKPMVCMRFAFKENDGNHNNDENDEDNSDSYNQGVERWIRGNHGKNTEMTKTTGIWGTNHKFPNNGLRNTQLEGAYMCTTWSFGERRRLHPPFCRPICTNLPLCAFLKVALPFIKRKGKERKMPKVSQSYGDLRSS